mgnify:CR=1 FL=1|tara:strand:- start:198 stop:629 length:432 start_codon:yes stop_codon:yes gene_type:complete
MADIGEAVITYLKTISAVTDLASTRFRPDELAEGETLPAVRYTVMAEDGFKTHAGKIGLAETRLQLDCYATTRAAANNLADVIVANLDGLTGATISSIRVHECFKDNRYYRADRPATGQGVSRRRVVLDFVIGHEIPTPAPND